MIIVTVAPKPIVRPHLDVDDQIARRCIANASVAFRRHAHAAAIGDAGRNVDAQRFGPVLHAGRDRRDTATGSSGRCRHCGQLFENTMWPRADRTVPDPSQARHRDSAPS